MFLPPFKVANCDIKDLNFFQCELKQKIGWKTVAIAFDRPH